MRAKFIPYFVIFVTFVAAVFVPFVAEAQLPTPAQPGDKPAFEVASIKPRGPEGPVSLMPYPTRVEAINYTVESLILAAYGLQLFQLADVQPWLRSERFDIIAKAEHEIPRGQGLAMLRVLLAERFKLRMHEEMRQLPIYELVVARKDGKLGPQLQLSPDHDLCTAAVLAQQRGEKPNGPACEGTRRISVDSMIGVNQSIYDFARHRLPYKVSRNVIDRTGLIGWFNYELTFAPDIPASPDAPAAGDRPSIFKALEEQLGLRLIPKTAAAQVLVIDHVERPTEN